MTSALDVQQTINEYQSEISRCGWSVTNDGVRKYKANGETDKIACTIPLIPTAIIENADSGLEEIELMFHKAGKWRKIVVPRSTVSNKAKIISLADNGIEVNSNTAQNLMTYIASYVNCAQDVIPFRVGKTSMGWFEDDFIPYSGKAVFDGEAEYRALYNAISSSGNLESWTDFMRPLRENLLFRLTMAAAFASPLVALIGENPFVFHLFGGTGSGKTVALMAAMSIFGNPALGKMTRTMNMTQNSILSTAAFLNNLPFAGDELQTIKSKDGYDELIMRITEGIDRGRMSYDKMNEMRTWKNAFLFTGEEPCTRSNSGGGIKNRVVEIECTVPLVRNGNEVVQFITKNYGTAALPFLAEAKKTDISTLYQAYYAELSKITTNKQAGAAALMLTGDVIASALFWREEKKLMPDDIAPFLKTEAETDVSERAYAFLCDWIAENISGFSYDSQKVFGTRGRAENEIYLIKSTLERILTEQGFDFNAVKSRWADKGYLVKYNTHFTQSRKINGASANCVQIMLPD